VIIAIRISKADAPWMTIPSVKLERANCPKRPKGNAKIKVEITGKSVDEIVKECDKDGNGVIDFKEFKDCVMKK
jgi:Ca2+-binding EF-hand superfamily protein